MARQRTRVFTGCSRCRARKVKCDEGRPGCAACRRLGRSCPGYATKLVWVQEGDGDKQPNIDGSDRRRLWPCDTTWQGFATLPSDLADLLIEQCDGRKNEQDPDSSSPTLWLSVGHNPFGVFPSVQTAQQTSTLLVSRRRASMSPPSLPSPAAPRAMVVFPDATDHERFLFHHYVSHLSDLMVPYEHPWNPWKRLYPAAALHQRSPFQKALHSAILSHAAFNVAHLRGGDRGGEPKMMNAATRIYGTALQQLVPHITDSQGDFSEILAAVMSLMFAEIYSGEPHTWRRHFRGAWMVFERYCAAAPWRFADMACLSLQSLVIVKIIGATSAMDEEPANSEKSDISTHDGRRVTTAPPKRPVAHTMQPWSLSQNPDEDCPQALAPILFSAEFGFTIGAPRVVLQCIASITDFRCQRGRGMVGPGAVDDLLQEVLARLNAYRAACELEGEDIEAGEGEGEDEGAAKANVMNVLDEAGLGLVGPLPPRPPQIPPEARAQRKAFLYATYVYLYRVLLHAPPDAVRWHVQKTFAHVTDFSAQTRLLRNFSVWPAFIAATEAYAPEDLAVARRWLQGAMTFGSGNRHALRRVLEEVWRRREALAAASGVDPGSIAVDWRQVMHELNCDVLIV